MAGNTSVNSCLLSRGFRIRESTETGLEQTCFSATPFSVNMFAISLDVFFKTRFTPGSISQMLFYDVGISISLCFENRLPPVLPPGNLFISSSSGTKGNALFDKEATFALTCFVWIRSKLFVK